MAQNIVPYCQAGWIGTGRVNRDTYHLVLAKAFVLSYDTHIALPVVGEASTSSAPLAGSDEVMFEEKDLSFEIEDLLLDGDNANSSSARDSGRGSSSNVSEACSQNGNRTYAGK